MDLTRAMTGIFGGLEFARDHAINLDFSELPFVELSDTDFVKRLPISSAIYFVLSPERKPLYIGKAIKLQERWRNHHCLRRAIEQPGIQLAWVEIVPVYLMMIESLFIMAFRPTWNQNEYFEDGDYWFSDVSERFENIWSKSSQIHGPQFGGSNGKENKEDQSKDAR